MEIKLIKKFAAVLFVLMLFVLTAQKTQAASGTISLSPQSGSYQVGNEFNVTLTVNGGGTSFNAAAATVTVPSALSVQSVTLGNCDFAFVITPTSSNPSFAGVILGSSSSSCTLYTLRIRAVSAGVAPLTLSNASIKAYTGASELLSEARSASYTISGGSAPVVSISPTQAPIVGVGGQSFYNLNYSFTTSGTPSQITVTLDPELSTKTVVTPVREDETYVARFENVPAGVHTISTYEDDEQIASQVVNVSGGDRNISIGQAKPSQMSPIYIAIGILILIAGMLSAFFGYKYYMKKKTPKSANTPVNK